MVNKEKIKKTLDFSEESETALLAKT